MNRSINSHLAVSSAVSPGSGESQELHRPRDNGIVMFLEKHFLGGALLTAFLI